MSGKKLFVGNLTFSTNLAQLKKLFSVYGEIEQANIIHDKGYGFVRMKSEEDANRARDALNGTVHEGKTLIVDFAKRGD